MEKVKREEERDRERIVLEAPNIAFSRFVLGLLEGFRGGVVVHGGRLVRVKKEEDRFLRVEWINKRLNPPRPIC